MNKFYKRAGILTGVLFLVGFVFAIIGIALGADTTIAYTEDKGIFIINEQKKYEYKDMDISSDKVKRIVVDTNAFDIEIVNGTSDDKFGIECKAMNEAYKPDITINNGELKISNDEEDIKFFINLNVFNIGAMKNELTIYVPRNQAVDGISVSTNVGDVRVNNSGRITNLMVDSQVGDIKLQNLDIHEMNIESQVGDVKAENVLVDNRLEIVSEVGDVKIDGELKCDMDIRSSIGDVEVDTSLPKSSYDYEISTSLGDAEIFGYDGDLIQENGNQYKIIIETEIGDIDVE